jgi:DNA-binding transcriptional regulator YiaG
MPTKTKKARKVMTRVSAKRARPATKKAAVKATAKTTATKPRAKVAPVPYVLKDSFVQVTVDGKPFLLNASHPTFAALVAALKARAWGRVPKLVTLARSIAHASHGNVTVVQGVISYKGKPVEGVLMKRILQLMQHGKPVKHMLAFMDQLYQNRSPEAKAEFFQWLQNNELPITDDGHFLAYKSVDANLRDQHTHTIDNSPGQVIMMARADADPNYRTQCSYGFHVCSKQYGLYGTRVLAVKVSPADVVAAEGGKMRVTRYEVIKELGLKEKLEFKADGFSTLERQLVVEIKAERQEVLKALLRSPAVKRVIRRGKIAKTTIVKATYARLVAMARQYDVLPTTGLAASETEAGTKLPLQAARKAAGLSVGQLAKKLSVDYKTLSLWERNEALPTDKADKVIRAIAQLRGVTHGAVAFPTPVEGR